MGKILSENRGGQDTFSKVFWGKILFLRCFGGRYLQRNGGGGQDTFSKMVLGKIPSEIYGDKILFLGYFNTNILTAISLFKIY